MPCCLLIPEKAPAPRRDLPAISCIIAARRMSVNLASSEIEHIIQAVMTDVILRFTIATVVVYL